MYGTVRKAHAAGRAGAMGAAMMGAAMAMMGVAMGAQG